MRGALLVLFVTACGRIGFDGPAGDDVPGDDGPGVFDDVPLASGGDSHSLALTPADPERLYVVAGGRAFQSRDHATTWTECGPSEYLHVVAARPDDADTVYAGGDVAIYRSRDACATWEQIGDATEVQAIVADGDDVLVGAYGVWRWHAGTMTLLSSSLDDDWIEQIVVSGQTILAASWNHGVVRSTNGGATFADANAGLATAAASGFAFVHPGDPSVVLVTNTDGVFRSTNGGAAWTASPGGEDGRDAIAVDPADGLFTVGASWHGMIRSADGGVSFDGSDPRTANMEASYAEDIAFDLGATGRAYAATGRGVFVASDHALGWTPSSEGIAAWEILSITGVPGQGVIYAATATGALRSEDNGATWTIESSGMSTYSSGLLTLAVPAAAPAHLLGGGGPFLWESNDGGRTFTVNGAGTVDDADGFEIRAIRTRGAEIWMGTATRVWSSTDFGATWSQHAVGAGDRWVNDVALAPDGDVWVASEIGVFRSANGGQTFTNRGTGAEIFTLLVLADGTVVSGGLDGVHTTTAAANSWTDAGLAGVEVYDLIESNGRWIAATDRGVRITADRGATWSSIDGLTARRPSSLYVADNGDLLVGTWGYGMYRAPLP